MLLATVTLWALNFTVTKYVITHGFQPVAYGCLRFGVAAMAFSGLAYARERALAIPRRDLGILAVAALIGIFLNQLAFVYAIKLTTATTVALLFGTLPVMTGLFSFALGIDRLGTRFWLAALLAFAGAALAALGFVIGTLPLFAVGAQQLGSQDYGFGVSIWLAYAFAVIGPLVVANLLWFGAIGRVGPSRASVFANLQPFLAAIFSLLILSESMTRLQVAGGLAIAAGIVLSRSRAPAQPAAAAEAGAAGAVRK